MKNKVYLEGNDKEWCKDIVWHYEGKYKFLNFLLYGEMKQAVPSEWKFCPVCGKKRP